MILESVGVSSYDLKRMVLMDAKIDQQTVRLLFKNQMEVLLDLTSMAITQVLSYDFGTEENLQFCSYLDR